MRRVIPDFQVEYKNLSKRRRRPSNNLKPLETVASVFARSERISVAQALARVGPAEDGRIQNNSLKGLRSIS